jgi:hypothetical protein
MPELLWLSLTALLYDRTSGSCIALAEGLETGSHDRLTRRLQGDGSGPTLLAVAWRTLLVWQQGYLISDDPVMPTPCAVAIEGLAWVFSRQERTPGDGLSLVLLVWTNGTLQIPRGMRLWRKGGPSKYELALEFLSSARPRLRCHPDSVLCEAWYPSRALLKRIGDDGGAVVCRLNKTRRFKGHAVRHHQRPPYWAEIGGLSGGLKGLVVRYGKKDYATNRRTLSAAEGRRLYRRRAQIEEVIRVCQAHRALTGCQARSQKAQQHHLTCCLVAFWVLAWAQHDRQLSSYKLTRQLSFKGRSQALPALERLRRAA